MMDFIISLLLFTLLAVVGGAGIMLTAIWIWYKHSGQWSPFAQPEAREQDKRK